MTSTGKTPQVLPPGIWQDLLRHAYTLIDEIARHEDFKRSDDARVTGPLVGQP